MTDLDPTPEQDVAEALSLNCLCHEPTRLAILCLLRPTGAADYSVLQEHTGLSKGNLSGHLARLEEAGVVEVRKRFIGKRPTTTACLTLAGAERLEAYWESMTKLGWDSRPLHGPESFLGGNISGAYRLAAEGRRREELHARLVRDPEVQVGNPVTRFDADTQDRVCLPTAEESGGTA